MGMSLRTTVTIQDDVLADLMRFTEASTRTEAVNRAVEGWVRRERIRRIKDLRGRLDIGTDVRGMREEEIGELDDLGE